MVKKINFTDKIHDYVGGTKEDFSIYELNKKRSLVYEPKSNDINRNFIVFLKDNKFHYNIQYNEALANKDITVHSAKKCNLFSLIYESKNFKLFECPKSLFLVNKTKNKLKVNDLVIDKQIYLSKGPPIFINDKLTYYEGSLL